MESCPEIEIGQVFSSADGEFGHVFNNLTDEEGGSMSCHLCNSVLKEPAAFWDHVSKIHGVRKDDYKIIEKNMQQCAESEDTNTTSNQDTTSAMDTTSKLTNTLSPDDKVDEGKDSASEEDVSEDPDEASTLEGNCSICDERVVATQIWEHVELKHGLKPEEYRACQRVLTVPDAEERNSSSVQGWAEKWSPGCIFQAS